MPEDQKTSQTTAFAVWEVHEYNHEERSFRWYLIAGFISLGLFIFSYFTDNFLLPVIIIITAFIFIMRHGQEPDRVQVALLDEGIQVGQKFYDYDLFRHFALVYKPSQNDRNLYFEFHNALRTRLSIPLENMNPIEIRNYLINFLKEDTERTDIPLSEQIAKKLKL
jgi:hypothetical protein